MQVYVVGAGTAEDMILCACIRLCVIYMSALMHEAPGNDSEWCVTDRVRGGAREVNNEPPRGCYLRGLGSGFGFGVS